ncbi:hypothetical protein [Streptomyces sp. bgisy060]|uniref:hypothetical protein n=1 Tax=Streptomyces sp. bgisy060 TaxID=3413775 RepID=UPI003EC02AA4
MFGLGVVDLDQGVGVVVGERVAEIGQVLHAHGVHERERAFDLLLGELGLGRGELGRGADLVRSGSLGPDCGRPTISALRRMPAKTTGHRR